MSDCRKYNNFSTAVFCMNEQWGNGRDEDNLGLDDEASEMRRSSLVSSSKRWARGRPTSHICLEREEESFCRSAAMGSGGIKHRGLSVKWRRRTPSSAQMVRLFCSCSVDPFPYIFWGENGEIVGRDVENMGEMDGWRPAKKAQERGWAIERPSTDWYRGWMGWNGTSVPTNPPLLLRFLSLFLL